MGKYALTSEARQDISNITLYTARQFGEDQARKYYNQLHQSAQLAADFPQAGRSYSSVGGQTYLQYDCGRHALSYVIEEDGILIGRVLHLMMNFDQHLD